MNASSTFTGATPPGRGKGGVIPPIEHRFRPGQSGNPRGRPRAGASLREWLNQMQGWPRRRLLRVLKDKRAPVSKVCAAQLWLRLASDGVVHSIMDFLD